jgi:hypothetical protein
LVPVSPSGTGKTLSAFMASTCRLKKITAELNIPQNISAVVAFESIDKVPQEKYAGSIIADMVFFNVDLFSFRRKKVAANP